MRANKVTELRNTSGLTVKIDCRYHVSGSGNDEIVVTDFDMKDDSVIACGMVTTARGDTYEGYAYLDDLRKV